MKCAIVFQQPTPTREPRGFDADLVWHTLTDLGESLLARTPYLIVAIIIFIGFIIGGRIVKGIILAAARRTRLDLALAQLLGRLASGALLLFGVFVGAVVVFPTFRPGDLVAGLGITSVAIGFAFRDVLQNFFAGILILWRQPFRVGDEIRAKDYEGTVEEINVRSTKLKTYDGERAILPNGDIYTSPILVRTSYDKRRVRFSVGIGYTESIDSARGTIDRVLSETNGVLRDPGPWVYVSELAPSSVNFVVYFWVEPAQANVLRVSDRVATSIKLALDNAGIDIPYPHTVVFFHDVTRKRGGDIRSSANSDRSRMDS